MLSPSGVQVSTRWAIGAIWPGTAGPTTAQGRARSARNAHRHGLSLPVLVDSDLSQEVEALAREMAGANASSEIQELARRIAEAQIDLRRDATEQKAKAEAVRCKAIDDGVPVPDIARATYGEK
jgi:enoyl-CoA hydratase/carnithine racemase